MPVRPSAIQTRLEAILSELVSMAKDGNLGAAEIILKRILPPTERHEHSLADDPSERDLGHEVAALTARRRANGSGHGADAGSQEDDRS